MKSLYRKAKALAYLSEFTKSRTILRSIGKGDDTALVDQLEVQANGDYHQVSEE